MKYLPTTSEAVAWALSEAFYNLQPHPADSVTKYALPVNVIAGQAYVGFPNKSVPIAAGADPYLLDAFLEPFAEVSEDEVLSVQLAIEENRGGRTVLWNHLPAHFQALAVDTLPELEDGPGP